MRKWKRLNEKLSRDKLRVRSIEMEWTSERKKGKLKIENHSMRDRERKKKRKREKNGISEPTFFCILDWGHFFGLNFSLNWWSQLYKTKRLSFWKECHHW